MQRGRDAVVLPPPEDFREDQIQEQKGKCFTNVSYCNRYCTVEKRRWGLLNLSSRLAGLLPEPGDAVGAELVSGHKLVSGHTNQRMAYYWYFLRASG